MLQAAACTGIYAPVKMSWTGAQALSRSFVLLGGFGCGREVGGQQSSDSRPSATGRLDLPALGRGVLAVDVAAGSAHFDRTRSSTATTTFSISYLITSVAGKARPGKAWPAWAMRHFSLQIGSAPLPRSWSRRAVPIRSRCRCPGRRHSDHRRSARWLGVDHVSTRKRARDGGGPPKLRWAQLPWRASTGYWTRGFSSGPIRAGSYGRRPRAATPGPWPSTPCAWLCRAAQIAREGTGAVVGERAGTTLFDRAVPSSGGGITQELLALLAPSTFRPPCPPDASRWPGRTDTVTTACS